METVVDRLRVGLAGRYTIERELGRGGMANVYVAHDVRHDRQVALKVLRPDLSSELAADRFVREIHLAARLTHPHILPLFDSGEAGGLLFYVMPIVEGESLRERLHKAKQLALEDATQIAGEVAEALDHAHRHGVVHRDIKPENILLQDGHAVVADFGIGRAVTAAAKHTDSITRTGVTVGTPAYMSPEQAAGEGDIDGRSDLYSLGCVLYEMLTGEPPFTGATAEAVIAKRLTITPPEVTKTRKSVPPAVSRAVGKLLERTPGDRFSTGKQLCEALKSAATATGPSPEQNSVAVLPFANLSADAENEYFSDGMTEEIINALVQVPGLRVAARTSAFAFKGKTDDLRAIAERLNVRAVVEGSVRKVGNRIRVTAQLVNAGDGYHLWSERYDRTLDDVFAVQAEIAEAIVDKLKVKLGGAGPAPLVRPATQDVEAYELYLQGRYFWSQRGKGLLKGLECFEAALAKDRDYSLAHAGVADSYTLLAFYGYVRPHEAMPKARAAAERALAINPTLAEAYTALGFILTCYDHDCSRAARAFQRAIELNPSYAAARYWYGTNFVALHRFSEAVAATEEALRIEPLSIFTNTIHGWMLLWADRVEEAARRLEHALELDPHFMMAHWLLGHAYAAGGRSEQGLVELRTAVELSGGLPFTVATLGMALAFVGKLEPARQIVRDLSIRFEHEYVPARLFAFLHAQLGDLDTAFEWFEKAREERDMWIPFLEVRSSGVWWIPERIRSDPRWAPFMARLGVKRE